ncbi:hypothetical protein J2T20_000109 [Paenibacillus wynnii]|nr:hypothetical protein [Paenibacillus wynnii]
MMRIDSSGIFILRKPYVIPTPKPSKLKAKASNSSEKSGLSTRNPSREEPETGGRSDSNRSLIQHSSPSIWAVQAEGANLLQLHGHL